MMARLETRGDKKVWVIDRDKIRRRVARLFAKGASQARAAHWLVEGPARS